jgi:peptidoglycan/xylan/chitin deacetylase (PgdA/CDA1 family)
MTRASLALGATLVLLGAGCGRQHSHLSIVISGRVVQVETKTTLGQAVDRLGLRPPAGNLIDVRGKVLHAAVFPGSLLLNGRRVASTTRVREGDRISFVTGRDRVERLQHQRRAVPGGISDNPQGRLIRTPGVEIVVRGAVSHKVLATRYQASGGPVHVERAVALTFDDGPSPVDTPKVLRILHRLHARATFFVIGFLVDAYPEIVLREHRAGMAIGNHTYNHPEVPPFGGLPRRLLDAEIELGAKSLSRIGIATRLLRPPAGSTSASVVRAAEAAGERVVLWSVDPVDWPSDVTPTQIKQRVLSAVQPGSIVILHDGGGDQSATVAALPGIIKGIRRKGLRLVPLSPI